MSGDGDKIKVACRVRPFISKEIKENAGSCIACNPCGNQNQLLIGTDKYFTYDYVVGPEEGQGSLYDKAIGSLVDGFFKGYNSTILAYGQTVDHRSTADTGSWPVQGSGKTFTMGSAEWTGVSEQEWGIIPRVMHRVFEHKQQQADADAG